ncbi:hypothetical protein JVU11DRAFT_10858 [Chiua virens]|nr:hypothetical protein JVU11DRAFT_10858 [Chiua virens]
MARLYAFLPWISGWLVRIIMGWYHCIRMVHTDILERTPYSLKTLFLQMRVYDWRMPPVFEGIFASPAWARLPALRSFTLKLECVASDGADPDDLVKAFDGINSAKGLKSFVLDCSCHRLRVPDTVCSEVQ